MKMEVVLAIVVPILLAPVLVVALKRLFMWFTQQGIDLFLEHEYPVAYSRTLGATLAKLNVFAGLLIWYAVYGIRLCDLPMMGCAAAAIFVILLALWLSVVIVRRQLSVAGWEGAQVGLIAFAGGNLPFFLIVPTGLALT